MTRNTTGSATRQPINYLDVTVARTGLSMAAASILALMLAAPALVALPSHGESDGPSAAQAIVAYGFLRWGDQFDQLVGSSPNLTLVQNLRALDTALKSLDCDVPNRMAMATHQEVMALASVPTGRWIDAPGPSRGSLGTWLFVMEPPGSPPRGTLVILSTEGPSQTTVFWLSEVGKGYQAKLPFDSFKKGKVSNETTVIGTATSIKFEGSDAILLEDWGEPGIGPPESQRVGRVFRLNLSSGTVVLVLRGTLPQH